MKLWQDVMKGSIDSLLMCLLSEQPMYGYQIIKELAQRSQGYFKFKEGPLYPALHRLESRGMVEGKWQMLPSGRQRRYYQVTEKGSAIIGERKNQWEEFTLAMNKIIQPAGI
jgi:PadR family transcriptional regulator, regulatory protein PadR